MLFHTIILNEVKIPKAVNHNRQEIPRSTWNDLRTDITVILRP